MAYSINKYYRNILGLDLRVSDLLRSQGAATEAKNMMFRQTGALSKRPGNQVKIDTGEGGAGLIKFNNVEIGTGTITEELLAVDDNLEIYTEQSFTITYAGSDSAYYDLYLDPDTANFMFEMYDNNVQVLSTNLGNGKGASDTTIAQVKTAVDAVTNFSMTISTAGTESAAYAPIGRSVNIATTGTTTNYYTYTTVSTPGTYTNPFSTHWATRNDATFETCSYAQMLDVLYIANGHDVLHKYDGNRVYKAGLPVPTTPTDATTGVGSLGTGASKVYKWIYTMEHTDAKQNILTSAPSAEVTHTTAGANESRDITMTNLTAAGGYGMAQAVVDGAQSGTTITVDSGHGLLVGDQVYAKDSGTAAVSKVEVTATTATTITVDSSITVANNAVISQTKLSLWRTKEDGSLYYLEEEFTNDNANATTTYTSTNADSTLVVDFTAAVKVPALPPTCKYIDVWRGQLVMTGNRDSVNTVYYSDFDGESFPVDQSFVTEARLGGGNSGIKSLDNTLFIFKPRSIITCTGDLGTDQFQVDGLADDGVGCVANATIKEIEGRLWFLGNRGIYSVNRSGHQKESEMIEPKFDEAYTDKRAIAHYWIEKDLYVISLPFLSTDAGSEKYLDTTNSFIMVYDLYRQAWFEWDSINFIGGIAEYNGVIYTSARELDPVPSTATTYTYEFLSAGNSDDYADHDTAISFSYKTHWEAMGEPSIYKKFLRMKIHSLDGTINDFETDKFTLSIQTEHDYVQAAESDFSLDFSGGALGWGSSAWGQFPWGESRLEQMTSKLKSKKAKALRTVFTNANLHENILISGYELEVSASYDLQIKE
jgi:hypothetical protein